MTAFADAIVESIYRQDLFDKTPQPPSGEATNPGDLALLAAVDTARTNIINDCLESAGRFGRQLQRLGIAFTFDAEALRRHPPQFQKVAIRLLESDPTAAVEAAIGVGYLSPLPLGRAGWAAWRRTRGELLLTHTDECTTRLLLQWPSPCARLVPGRVKPTLGDAAAADWPPVLWPLVLASRPLRVCCGRPGDSAGAALGEWLGTPTELLTSLFELASLSADDVLLDVGCGDGRVLVEAASRIGCRCIGVERDAHLAGLAAAAVRDRGLSDLVTIRHGDAADHRFPEATVIFLFIPAPTLGPALTQLLKTLQPGARVIAHEQRRYRAAPQPARRVPLIGKRALTVAMLWQAGATPVQP